MAVIPDAIKFITPCRHSTRLASMMQERCFSHASASTMAEAIGEAVAGRPRAHALTYAR
jgi:hypothetical protein